MNASTELLERVKEKSICAKLHDWTAASTTTLLYEAAKLMQSPTVLWLPPRLKQGRAGIDEMTQYMADCIDDLCINGGPADWELGNTDVTERSFWEGYRYVAAKSGVTQVQCSTFSIHNLAQIVDSSDRCTFMNTHKYAWIASPLIGAKMNALCPVSICAEGGPYTAQLFGFPVFFNEQVPENLNTCGYYDGKTATKTVMLHIAKQDFMFVCDSAQPITISRDSIILKVGFYSKKGARYPVGIGVNIS